MYYKYMDDIFVVKATGEKELFSDEKLRRSVKRAGIPDEKSDKVLRHIRDILYPDIPTSIIYRHIIEFLKDESYLSGKYSLKQAIMDFGPTGFPFEKFIAKIFTHLGYFTETDLIIPGKCVTHEVDVLARKSKEEFLMECKFHNLPGRRTDIKIALYVYARFQDIMENRENGLIKDANHTMWVVTNTKCTIDAISYARCRGMRVLSWGYPPTGNLQDEIENYRLHPVTCLRTISPYHIKKLLDKEIVLCRDLVSGNCDLEHTGLSVSEKHLVIEEAKRIIG
jgi:hypothetical protein